MEQIEKKGINKIIKFSPEYKKDKTIFINAELLKRNMTKFFEYTGSINEYIKAINKQDFITAFSLVADKDLEKIKKGHELYFYFNKETFPKELKNNNIYYLALIKDNKITFDYGLFIENIKSFRMNNDHIIECLEVGETEIFVIATLEYTSKEI